MLPKKKSAEIHGGGGSNGGVVVNVFNRAGISIPQLRAALNGRVIAPDDARYDEARTVFYGGIDRHPAVIVRAADATEVSHVVSLARETGLKLAVRSGGHSGAGHSVSEGGIVLDLRDMRALEIDAERRTAWAETGLTAGEYTTSAGAYGLATRVRRHRLAAIKARYDPTNLFRLNQNIAPAIEGAGLSDNGKGKETV